MALLAASPPGKGPPAPERAERSSPHGVSAVADVFQNLPSALKRVNDIPQARRDLFCGGLLVLTLDRCQGHWRTAASSGASTASNP